MKAEKSYAPESILPALGFRTVMLPVRQLIGGRKRKGKLRFSLNELMKDQIVTEIAFFLPF